MSKRVYVNRDESLTIKLDCGQYFEATFSNDEIERILVTKLYGKNATSMRDSDDELYGCYL